MKITIKARRRLNVASLSLTTVAALALSACAPPGADGGSTATATAAAAPTQQSIQADETANGFNLEALIEAARKEKPITIYDQTGKVVKTAESFTAKYGIKATGVKVELGAIEKVSRESAANNVVADVLVNEDIPAFAAELLDLGILTNWVPGDLKEKIDLKVQYPLQLHYGPFAWVYNSEKYDKCPISNVWELTKPEYAGRVAMADPLSNAKYAYWFNSMALNDDQKLREQYRKAFGQDLQTSEPDAAHEWVKRFAANKPLITKTDEEVSEAVGAPGQENPAIGPVSMAKFRNIADKGYKMAICSGLEPSALQAFPSAVAMVTKTKSPNAAKLYIHYLFTEEGFAPQLADGKVSTNASIPKPTDPSNVKDYIDQMSPFRSENLVSHYQNKTTWNDFWRQNHR